MSCNYTGPGRCECGQLGSANRFPKVVIKVTEFDFPITVKKTSQHSFSVQYGRQLKRGLDYAAAAKEFGECVFHSAMCAGRLD